MAPKRLTYHTLASLLIILLGTGCSVEKNTGASRFYNSLISKYNIYFNGNEAYKAGVAKVKENHRDDYNVILPVFEYSSPEAPQACSAEMERAIQKASKVISLYSITARPEKKKGGPKTARDEEFNNRKEYNEWVDDSYLLMAKAQFYQKNYSGARSTLSYNLGITTDPDIVKESGIWLARILTEEGNYPEADRVLKTTGEFSDLPRMLREMAYTTSADIALRQKQYDNAVTPLTRAVEAASAKNTRVRLTYLLAQVCKAAGNNNLSTRYFRDVIRMNPSYEFEFNAGINLAGVTDISSGDAAELKRSLNKMLRDTKNKDYLDQIYYALGELERRQNNIDKAIEMYTRSAKSSVSNNKQKARAYLALGQYFYSLPQYSKAQLYYDSTVALIDKKFPDYDIISHLSDDLNQYALFHNVVVLEDSLQKVAMMSLTERDKLISGIIKKKEEEAAKPDDGRNDRYNMGQYYENERRSQDAISAEGSWYFYNQAALTFGRTEFRRRWGDRSLEDNWRRLNRTHIAIAQGTTEESETTSEKDSVVVGEERTKEFYLKNLPLTDSLMQVSKNKSAEALLGEGKILASRLSDTLRAAEALEKASEPGGRDETRAEAMYELYRLFYKKDTPRAERRRDNLISLFPKSEYALILSDPDYVRHQNEAAKASIVTYESAYVNFKSGRYSEATVLCDEALVKYPDDELTPKFMLLGAMATGAVSGQLAYKEKLDSLVARYPQSEEGKRAAEIITVLRREIPEIKIAEDKQIARTLYSRDSLNLYNIMVIAGNTSSNINQLVFDIINYNLDNYGKRNYKTTGEESNAGYHMIIITGYESEAEAIEYLKAFDPLANIRGASEAKISLFIISQGNLEKFRTDKNISRYSIYHKKTYPELK